MKKFIFPRVFDNNASTLAFPLGGIGTGTISLGSRGQLKDWEIFSKPDKGRTPRHSLAMIWVGSPDKKTDCRILEACIQPPYEGVCGLGRGNLPGLPRFRKTEFTGNYPFATVRFHQPDFPVQLSLEAFNPMIPLDIENSSLPIAVLRYTVENKTSKNQRVCLAYSLTNFNDQHHCYSNFARTAQNLKAVRLSYKDGSIHKIDGTVCIGTDGTNARILPNWNNSKDRDEAMAFWDYFSKFGKLSEPKKDYTAATASVASDFMLKPKCSKQVTFYITWHFSRRTIGACAWNNWQHSPTDDTTNIGNYYAGQYTDAWDAMKKIVPRLPKLEKETRKFVSTLAKSSLPPAVLDAVSANMSTIRTQTIFRTANGRFHGFEGCTDKSGAGFGDCHHVYNYETATGSLFPQIAGSFLDTILFINTDENGINSFRTILPVEANKVNKITIPVPNGLKGWLQLPIGTKRINKVAADGTLGTIVRLYRYWQLTGNTKQLKKFWPAVKNIFAFTWKKNSWDGDMDGVLEGVQHNTYDCEFYGPNPLCTNWYLAALNAATKMADELNDCDFADKCRKLFTNGSKWVDKNLFNGEYYKQIVKSIPANKINPVFETRTGARNRRNPYHQIENGCLIDQVVGQYFAHICNLGYILNRTNIKKALSSILKYNFKENFYGHQSTQRCYALNNEAGVVVCSYPHNDRPELPMPYINEIMTGFEYQLAAHLIYEGMIQHGLKIVESIRNRFDGLKRNCWDEAEYGHHYARAMASWALLPALSGFQWSAIENSLKFDPKINQNNFSTFFITPTCWGTYSQKNLVGKPEFEIKILYGNLILNQLCLPIKGKSFKKFRLNGKIIKSTECCASGLKFTKLKLKQNDVLSIK